VRPTRDTAAGRAYLDLQKKAREDRQPTEAPLVLYALEGFLARLAASGHSDKLVLKGGVLLAAFLLRRPTRDVDLQAQAVPNNTAPILDLVAGIAAGTPAGGVDDGLVFAAQHATAEVIRDEDAYSGVRVSLTCTLHTARIVFHVDVSVGDPIWPAARAGRAASTARGHRRAARLPDVDGSRGEDRHRYRPRHRKHPVARLRRRVRPVRHPRGDAVDLQAAIGTVAAHRQVQLQPLKVVLDGYEFLAQTAFQTLLGLGGQQQATTYRQIYAEGPAAPPRCSGRRERRAGDVFYASHNACAESVSR
jgi:hypothetical protein